MINTKEYILDLSMPEKVSLFNELYSELSGYGTDGDTELAHVNTFEVKLLKSVGGSGTINEITELQQFGGGGQPAPPANQTVSQTTEFPPELRPFIQDILGEAQAEFQREQAEGFLPFPGPQIAAFTPEQQAAFETGRGQFTGLAGTPLAAGETYARPALAATALGTSEIGAQDIGRRMDPFIQNVVDIAKREATRDEEAAVQGRAAQAVGAGSFGGTRQALVESEAERNLAERLGDIQARGLSTAFQNAQQSAEAQRQRELAGGRQFAAIGDVAGQRARGDIGGLAGIGETQQQRGQQALDIARQEFGQEQVFPAQTLGKYQSVVRGFPYQMGFTQQAQQTIPTPSLAQTLGGGLQGAAGLYGMFGGFGGGAGGGATGGRVGNIVDRQGGGLVSLEDGGAVERLGGGLFKRSGTAQPQASAIPIGRGLPPEIMELLRKHAQENQTARSGGGLVSLQGGGVPTTPTTGGVPQVPLGAQKMVPHLMKMYESNPQFKNKIDQDIQRMVPQVQGVNLGAGGAQTNLGMAGAPPYVPVRSGGGLVSLQEGTEKGTIGDIYSQLFSYEETQAEKDRDALIKDVLADIDTLPTKEDRLDRADKRRMQALYASLNAGGAGIMGADPQKGYAAAVGEGIKTGLPIAAEGMEGYYDALDEADLTGLQQKIQKLSILQDQTSDKRAKQQINKEMFILAKSSGLLGDVTPEFNISEMAAYIENMQGYDAESIKERGGMIAVINEARQMVTDEAHAGGVELNPGQIQNKSMDAIEIIMGRDIERLPPITGDETGNVGAAVEGAVKTGEDADAEFNNPPREPDQAELDLAGQIKELTAQLENPRLKQYPLMIDEITRKLNNLLEEQKKLQEETPEERERRLRIPEDLYPRRG